MNPPFPMPISSLLPIDHMGVFPNVSILGAGLSLGQSIDGVQFAPQALRQAHLKENLQKLGWHVHDEGDLPLSTLPLQSPRPEPMDPLEGRPLIQNSYAIGQGTQLIASATAEIGKKKHFCLTLGGDHSIGAGSIMGLLQAWPDLAVVWVDAHGDCNTPEISPSGKFHGMPIAALTDAFDVSQYPGFEEFKGGLSPSRVALVGIRDLDTAERYLIQASGIHLYTMNDIDRYGIGRVMEAAIHAVSPSGESPLHLSFDVDALDPSLAPSTGTRVPGGLTYREAHYIAEVLAETGQLVSMDLVEVNPKLAKIEGDKTVEMSVELIQSALGKRIADRRHFL